MRLLLGWFEALATRRPRGVISGPVLFTVVMAGLASNLELEVDFTQLRSEDSEAGQAMDRLQEEFGDPSAAVQVILDAGPENSMLNRTGLREMLAAEEATVEALGGDVRMGGDGRPQLISLGSAVVAAVAQQGQDPASLSDPQLGQVVGRLVEANPLLAGLISDDFDPRAVTARGTVVVALLDPTLSTSQQTEAAKRVKVALEAGGGGRIVNADVTVFSSGLFVAGMADASRAEIPMLLGLALLVVLAILALTYRSLFDVVLALAGLLMAVIWTLGFASLLGPSFLGWTGPLTQIAAVIPVLLVGLGVDYAVHLTARYREQRSTGQLPAEAAGRSLRTVGAALVLATLATAAGFASIATAPLQMLADFGVFVAIGVVCAFLIMSLMIPAARVLRDRRREDLASAAVRQLGLSGLMAAPVRLVHRRPTAGLVSAGVLVAASLLAASGLEVDFNRDDFVPEGSDIAAVLAIQRELFGGGVTETTFVLVDGDLTDPAIANSIWEAQQEVVDIGGVRRVGEAPQIISVIGLVGETLGRPAPSGSQSDAGMESPRPPVEAWRGDGFAPDADLVAVYDWLRETVGAERVAQLLTADARTAVIQIRTTVGDAGAGRIRHEVTEAFAPLQGAGATVTVTSEPIIIAEMSEELSAFQMRAIALTLAVVLLLLSGYYAIAHRRYMLGMIAMIPAVVGASVILGAMWVLGITFNMLTATLTAIAIGIGVPYGVHVVNRFLEDIATATVADAVDRTLRAAGAALAGSALTTLGAFVVLSFSVLPPMRTLGLLGGIGIAFALIAGVLVEPGALVLWARRQSSFTR